jgi:hypothetical protein
MEKRLSNGHVPGLRCSERLVGESSEADWMKEYEQRRVRRIHHQTMNDEVIE